MYVTELKLTRTFVFVFQKQHRYAWISIQLREREKGEVGEDVFAPHKGVQEDGSEAERGATHLPRGRTHGAGWRGHHD